MVIFAGKRPANLGAKEGKLAPCPSSPNCVCSQASQVDGQHYIDPLPLVAIADIAGVVTEMERTTIVTESDTYLYAEFKSKLMGFVDDVEFFRDEAAGVVHVRSASRLGQSDLGVNRQRVETIRQQLPGSN